MGLVYDVRVMDVRSVGSGALAVSRARNATDRARSRVQHSDLVRTVTALVVFLVATVGCSRRTEVEVSVGTTEQALTPSDWPAEALVVTNSIHLDQRASVTGDVAAWVASPGPVLFQNASWGSPTMRSSLATYGLTPFILAPAPRYRAPAAITREAELGRSSGLNKAH